MQQLFLPKSRFLRHLVFWILYSLSWVWMDMMYGIPFEKSFYRYLACVLEIPFYYIHMYYLWPRFVSRKKFFYYFLALIPLLISSALLVLTYRYFLEYPIILDKEPPENLYSIPSILRLSRSILLWFGPPTAIKILGDLYNNKLHLEVAKKEKKTAELNFLKSQMNPHFLFNTLNNLYALSVKGSPQTPEALLKLSNILSYTLHEGREDQISLEKEVQLLNDYIELERLRFGDRLNLKFEISGDLKGVYIPPLILVHLVENAFKHCSLNERGKVDIQIYISTKGKQLHIRTINPVANKAPKQNEKNGIGVQNLKKRLEILFPNNHSFTLKNESEHFYVDLIIPI